MAPTPGQVVSAMAHLHMKPQRRPRRVPAGGRSRFVPCAALCLFMVAVSAQDPAADGPFTDAQCATCHEQTEPSLMADWHDGPHGRTTDLGCGDCHGEHHIGALAAARRNEVCESCHQGPATRSYATSKHGVIMGLMGDAVDWGRAPVPVNYRVPGCSYCHLRGARHGDAMGAQADAGVRQWICAGCHSPRYVRELFANAKRQKEIAELKADEARGLLATAPVLPAQERTVLRRSLSQHLRNVRLGVGHQSPDYQWWHGQPALDGDLIRIRRRIAGARRRAGPPVSDSAQ